MRTDETNELIDLGDAVSETKGAQLMGVPDQIGNFKQSAGLVAED